MVSLISCNIFHVANLEYYNTSCLSVVFISLLFVINFSQLLVVHSCYLYTKL